MIVVNNFPSEVRPCPVCKTKDNTPCGIIIVNSPLVEGQRQVQPVHLGCINLHWNTDHDLFYQRVQGGKDYVAKKNDSNKLGGTNVVPPAEPRKEDTPHTDVRKEGKGLERPSRSNRKGGLGHPRG